MEKETDETFLSVDVSLRLEALDRAMAIPINSAEGICARVLANAKLIEAFLRDGTVPEEKSRAN